MDLDKGAELWPEQPAPIKNEYPACWDLVLNDLENSTLDHPVQAATLKLLISDILKRDATGVVKYGTRLQPFNGRDPIQDSYEEHLDAIVYTKAAIYEQSTIKIITPESEFTTRGLHFIYAQALDSALKLRFIIEMRKKQHESSIDASNRGNTKEPGNDQSNIIIS